jgi:hypothetical protein
VQAIILYSLACVHCGTDIDRCGFSRIHVPIYFGAISLFHHETVIAQNNTGKKNMQVIVIKLSSNGNVDSDSDSEPSED